MNLDKIKKLLPLIMMGLAGLIFIFSFFYAFNVVGDGETEGVMSGLQAAFGGKISSMDDTTGAFSFANFLGYFLPLLVSGGLLFTILKKIDKPIIQLSLSAGLVLAFFLSIIFVSGVAGNVKGDAGVAISTVIGFGSFLGVSIKISFASVIVILFAIAGFLASGLNTYFIVKENYLSK